MFKFIISHPLHEILTTSWMQNRKLNKFELILMQVLYLVEVLLMTFSLLAFGNSQQVNDCHPVFLTNNLLRWNPLYQMDSINGGVSLPQKLLVHFCMVGMVCVIRLTLQPFQSFTLAGKANHAMHYSTNC